MNEDTSADLNRQLARMKRSVKLGFYVVLLGVSLFNVLESIFLVPKFEQIFHDMLGGKALPGITGLIVSFHAELIAIGILIPVAGIVICRFASLEKTIISLSALTVAVSFQIAVTCIGLLLPLVSTCDTMSAGPGG
ncbi:MAG: hypothetical protein WCD79_05660 [Chthoniobacteraceae bacterium]